MSASEKLKVLDVANDRDADHWDRVTASARIRESLPQIVAVTKWAETNENILRSACAELGWNQTPANGLREALKELDDALS